MIESDGSSSSTKMIPSSALSWSAEPAAEGYERARLRSRVESLLGTSSPSSTSCFMADLGRVDIGRTVATEEDDGGGRGTLRSMTVSGSRTLIVGGILSVVEYHIIDDRPSGPGNFLWLTVAVGGEFFSGKSAKH